MSVLSDLAQLAEERTEDYALACNLAAEADADYHRCYFSNIARSGEGTVAGREREAESKCVEEKVALIRATAAEKVAKQSITTVLARLSAAQSYYRMVERQT